MAENDIKQKIVLEGEKEYRQALKDANRELKTLKSELKAETAEMGRNATEQQKNEVRIKNLQKQIKEQEKVVKTYTEALKEVREKYADNQDEIAKWEQKLNNARTTLANMQNDLEGVNESFRSMQGDANMATVATKSLADTFGSLANLGGSISDTIEGIFTGMVSTVKNRITEIWSDVVDLAARSNNLVDLAGFWNTDVMTIQKYAGAVSEVSGSLEDLNALVTKINAGDAKKITELTGISDANYQDQWEYAMAVMDALNKMDKTSRNNAAFEIFGGKQATKAFDLLNDWDNLISHLEKYDAENGGYGLSEEDQQTISDLYDKVNGLKQSWQSLKDMATVKLFGSLSMDLTSNAQGILDGFLAYFNAESDEEREEALKQVEDNILAMFERAKQAILDGIALLDQVAKDLKDSENPTAQALGNILGGLVDALQWLTADNLNNVGTALEILAAFWLTGKGLQMGMDIAEVVKNIALIKAFSAGGATAGAAGAAAGGGGFLAGSASAIKAAAKTALPALLGVGLVVNDSLNNHGDENAWTEEETAAVLKKNTGFNSRDEYLWWNQMAYGHASLEMTPEQWAAANAFWDAQRKHDGDFTDEEWDAFEGAFAGQEELFDKINELMDYFVQSDHPDDWTGIEDLPSEWWKNPNNGGEGITNDNISKFNQLPENIKRAVAQAVSGISVNIDGQAAGRILAPYVSTNIAAGIQ